MKNESTSIEVAPNSEAKPTGKARNSKPALALVNGETDSTPKQTDSTPESTAPRTIKFTDVWNAELFAEDHAERARCCAELAAWLLWDGRRWELDDSKEKTKIKRLAIDTARKFAGLAAPRSDDEKHATKLQNEGKYTRMVNAAACNPKLAVEPESLDVDPLLFNVANGTIDLRTGELRPHAQSDLITKLSLVIFDALAECPTWLAFLDRIFAGNAALIAFVQRMFGYCLTGSVEFQVMFFLYGGGRNGKSVLLKVLAALLGAYAEKAPPKLLFESDEHPAEVAKLKGVRAALCAEVPKGRNVDEGKVKDLTGGETVTARPMYGAWFDFTPTHKFLLAGNHKPEIRGGDDGIWRRMMLVPFNVQIPENEVDPHLFEKLQSELSGILNWAIAGWLDLQKNGLQPPDEVRTAVQDYRDESDPLAEFFELRLVFEPNAVESRKFVASAYKGFCEENGMRPLNARDFAAALRKCGVVDGGTTRVVGKPVDAWRGVRLKTDKERELGIVEPTASESTGTKKMVESQRAASMNEPEDW